MKAGQLQLIPIEKRHGHWEWSARYAMPDNPFPTLREISPGCKTYTVSQDYQLVVVAGYSEAMALRRLANTVEHMRTQQALEGTVE